MQPVLHQYVDRSSGQICTERLYQDRLVKLIYSSLRENSPAIFKALTSRRVTQLAGLLNYDLPLGARLAGNRGFLKRLGVNLDECLQPPERLNTPRRIFERQIRYWKTRPLPSEADAVVSPADARVLVGSLNETSQLWIKEKFFQFEELLGCHAPTWVAAFEGGDFAVFRLTPEKYHWNHVPVSGEVVDHYDVDGAYHSCNPGAVVTVVTPYSKNRRVVTVIDTDVPGGSGVGLVAMIEVVALMIGQVVQRYSRFRYDKPREVRRGMFLQRGQPKSLFRPGSSTDVLLFQHDRVRFAEDLVSNMHRAAESRFTAAFGRPLVETDLRVRSTIAHAREARRTQSRANVRRPQKTLVVGR